MAWADRYIKGKLGGAEFFLKEHKYDGSHRVAVYQFPESDRVEYQRQGRSERTFDITAYLVTKPKTEDYDIQRDKLLDILERGGKHELHHPNLGVHQVEIRSYSVSETSNEAGYCAVQMQLSKVRSSTTKGEPVEPQLKLGLCQAYELDLEGAGELVALTEAMNQTSPLPERRKKWYEKAYGAMKSVGGFLIEKPLADRFVASKGVAKARKAFDKMLSAIDNVRTGAKSIDSYKKIFTMVRNAQDQLIYSTAGTINAIRQILRVGVNPYGGYPLTPAQMLSSFREYLQLGTERMDAAETKGSFGWVINNIMNNYAMSSAITYASAMAYDTATDVDFAEESCLRLLNNQLQSEEISQKTRDQLQQIKADFVDNMRIKRGEVGTFEWTNRFTVPSLVATYNATGSIDSEAQTIDLNTIENPLFTPANSVIKVVNRGGN